MNIIENLDILSVAIAVAGTFVLGFTVFFSDKKSITNKTFLFCSIVTGIWGLVNFFGYRITEPQIAFLLLRFVMFLAVLQAFSIFQLFYVFPKTTIVFSNIYKFFLVPVVLLTAFISASPLVLSSVKEISEAGNIIKINNGPAIPFFGIISITLVVSALFIFIRNLIRSKDAESGAYIKILIGTIFMFGFIIIFNFIFPAVLGNSKYLPFSALFTFPFIIFATYAILHHKLFNIKVISTATLVFLLAIVLFIEIIFVDSIILMIFRGSIFLLVLIFGINLIRSVIQEVEQRQELQDLIKQRESLVYLITHKVKGAFTRSKYIFAEMISGGFGDISLDLKNMAKKGLDSDNAGITTVDLILNAYNLEKGTVKYDMKPINFKDVILESIEDKKGSILNKKLILETDIKEEKYMILGDPFWIKEIVNNLLQNSILYTKEGKITVGLLKNNNKILFYIKDTGIGISDEDKKSLFTEGGRGKESVKTNVDSTGYGLFSSKLIVKAHKGRIWAESEEGKGSTFFVEFEEIK